MKQNFLQSFFFAAFGGAAAAVGADLADPKDFNFHSGWGHLIEVAMAGAASGVAVWFALQRKSSRPAARRKAPAKHGPQ